MLLSGEHSACITQAAISRTESDEAVPIYIAPAYRCKHDMSLSTSRSASRSGWAVEGIWQGKEELSEGLEARGSCPGVRKQRI